MINESCRTFGEIYAGWAWSEPFFREKTYLSFGVKNHIQFIDDIFIPFFQQHDVNDLLAQMDTWLRGDISDNSIYNGDFDKALGSIKAKMIILPVDHDRYFPPWTPNMRLRAFLTRNVASYAQRGDTWRRRIRRTRLPSTML